MIITATAFVYYPPGGGGGSKWYAPATGAPATLPVAPGTNALAAGNAASATGGSAIAFGTAASCTATDGIAIGSSSSALLAGSGRGIAIGNTSTCNGEDGIAIGTVATSGQQGVALGYFSSSNGPSVSANVAVGPNTAVCDYGISIGNSATTAGNFSRGNVAIGWGADARNSSNSGAVQTYITNSVAMGFSATAHNEGEIASAIVFPGVTGAVGHERGIKCTAMTTDATPTDMETNVFGVHSGAPAAAILPRIPDNSAATFIARVVAYQTGGGAGTVGDSAGWTIKGVFKKIGAGAFVLVGVPTVTAEGADAGTAWAVAVAANANGLQIQVTGEVNKTVTWTGCIDAINTL